MRVAVAHDVSQRSFSEDRRQASGCEVSRGAVAQNLCRNQKRRARRTGTAFQTNGALEKI
jgi:hypothetical protein